MVIERTRRAITAFTAPTPTRDLEGKIQQYTGKVGATFLTSFETQATYGSRDFRANRQRYLNNEMVFACVDIIGDASNQIRIEVKNQRGGSKVPDHPLQQLIRRPNPFMTESDLMEGIIKLQLLAGRCVLEKERDRSGRVIGLWPLRPDFLTLIPSATGNYIAGFEYGPAGSQKKFIPYIDTVDMPLWDPIHPLIALNPRAPVSQGMRVIDTDSQATDYVKLLFEKGGIPPGLLTTDQSLMPTQVEELRASWLNRYGGWTKWTAPAILSRGASYQKIGMSFSEMGFDYLDRRNESRIAAAFKIPPIVAGFYVGLEKSNYDNYLTARKAWWQDSLLPRFRYILDRLMLELVSAEFAGQGVILEYNLDGVYALQEDKDMKWRLFADALRAGGITVNEYREGLGYATIGGPGDVFLRQLALYEAPRTSTGGNPQVQDIGGEGESGTQDEQKILMIEGHSHKAARKPPNDDERSAFEQDLEKAIQQALDGQLDDIVKEARENGIEAVMVA